MHPNKLVKFVCILLLSSQLSYSQENLKYDQLFINCIDKWVVFPMGKDSTWAFGFVYFDTQAGLTLELDGKYRIEPGGKFKAERVENASFKIRLKPTSQVVAYLPEERFAELGIEKHPDWLSIYNDDSTSAHRLYALGYAHNAWNECEKALTYLESARKADPKLRGLDVELAFSYNCLEQYDKAIAVLEKALVDNPLDAYTNKEYIYSVMKSGDLDKALQFCKQSIKDLTDTRYHGENAYNILYNFYLQKDKKNFKAWIEETRKWNKNDERIMKSIDAMEKEMM